MTGYDIAFPPPPPSPAAEALRIEVRAFLAETMRHRTSKERAESWIGVDTAFSRDMGRRGWIGMTWPKAYGGHERSALERYVVVEEMLAAGAPVNAHWIADRQSGPAILKYGTEQQRRDILPRIARGECYFCIGMSEPDSGSDLASARTRAVETADGWRVNGTKLWTSGAHQAHYMILFCKTGGSGDSDRHGGASQFLVDLTLPGISIRPVHALTGEHHFNEVHFTDALLPKDALLGQRGDGWAQVMSELAFERSGPERFLSSFQVFAELVQHAASAPPDRATHMAIGRIAARTAVLRRMSRSVAGMLEAGQDPSLQAALVKDLGNSLEQEIPDIVRAAARGGAHPDLGSDNGLDAALAYTIQHAPSFSLRGGTREILRGIIARGLGLR